MNQTVPILYAPPGYHDLPPAARERICNGCGSARAKFDFVPDTIFGLPIRAACDIHDYMYFMGETIEDKERADRVFLNNLLRLIDARGGWLRSLRRLRAWHYYRAVAALGGPAFWQGKTDAHDEN